MISAFLKKHSWKLLISIALFVFAIAVVAAITDEVVLEKEQNVDLWIQKFFEKYIFTIG